MNRKINVLFFDVDGKKKPEKRTIEDDLPSYYDLIKCDGIDIVTRKICGYPVRVVCDDLGLINGRKISGIELYSNCVMFVGNLVLTGMEDAFGDLTSLSDKAINTILNDRVCVLLSGERVLLFDGD